MERKIAGMIGAIAALGTVNAAQATPAPTLDPTEVLRANSFAELLEPLPNAAAVLRAIDEAAPARLSGDAVRLAQYGRHDHHHHHHHHSQWQRVIPQIVIVQPRRRYHHHHHHHHHHHSQYYRY